MHRDNVGIDRRILAAVTRRGRRLLTHRELLHDQVQEDAILRRARNGVLQRVHNGVYLVGAGALTWQEKILAGVLAGGPAAQACGFSALRLFGLETYAPGRVIVAIPYETACVAEGVTFVRTRRSSPRTTQDGVPCVTVEQALLDVAARLPERDLHRLLTTAWRKQLTTPKRVLAHVEAFGGRGVKGTRKLRNVAAMYSSQRRGPGSEAEADFVFELFEQLDRRGIERPELQFAIDVRDGTERVVPDLVWPLRWKVVEVKGLKAHGDYLIQDDDVERESAIRAAGWDLDCVTPRAMRERREKTIARVIRFLETPNARWAGSGTAAA